MGSDRTYPQRLAAARAGFDGDRGAVQALLHDPDAATRARAIGALVRIDPDDPEVGARITEALSDPSPLVRRRAAQLATRTAQLLRLLGDPDTGVVVAACEGLGEASDADVDVVARLALVATDHADALCREAAVAALGSIGDPAGIDAVLCACADTVAVRRRAVLMLAAWDDERCHRQLVAMTGDRDRQVRQAAEDLLSCDGTDDVIDR